MNNRVSYRKDPFGIAGDGGRRGRDPDQPEWSERILVDGLLPRDIILDRGGELSRNDAAMARKSDREALLAEADKEARKLALKELRKAANPGKKAAIDALLGEL